MRSTKPWSLQLREAEAHRMGFKSVQELDANLRKLKADPLWVYAYEQYEARYYELCARLGIFPQRRRMNPIDYRII